MVAAILKSSRPHQWVKNLFFVGAPLVFARKIDEIGPVLHTAVVVTGFCLISSAVYLFNDIVDVEKDRVHPLKRLRPIASGTLSIGAARLASLLFALVGLLACFSRGTIPVAIAAAYLIQNLAY